KSASRGADDRTPGLPAGTAPLRLLATGLASSTFGRVDDEIVFETVRERLRDFEERGRVSARRREEPREAPGFLADRGRRRGHGRRSLLGQDQGDAGRPGRER